MEAEEPIAVEDTTVGCDGGNALMGHPMVYLKIAEGGEAVCPYCSRRFVRTGKPPTKH